MRFLPILAAITIGLFAATAANAQGMSTGMRSQTMGTMSQGMDRPMMKKKMSEKRMMRMKRMKTMGTGM